MAVEFRFRRWDDMTVDADNYIQVLKYQQETLSKAEEKTISVYSQLCAIFIASDHNKLYKFLHKTPLATRRRKVGSKGTDKGFGFEEYEYLEEKMQSMDKNDSRLKKLGDYVLLKTIVKLDLLRGCLCWEDGKKPLLFWPI
jgi:hypothetical protein